MSLNKYLLLLLFCFVVTSCKTKQSSLIKKQQIAFIADVHLQDIFGTFEDNKYKGIANPVTGEFANIRTMGSQLQSTRLYNENYFAFMEALNDIARRGIKVVALPGDFSDDGQPIHVRGLKKILDEYAQKYGMTFLVTTGNHDVIKPFAQEATKTDFLGKDGKEQIITSLQTKLPVNKDELAPIITSEIKNWGYKEMTDEMANFGFFPQNDYLYWETPFSNYTYENYSFEKGKEAAPLDKRVYNVKGTNQFLPDVSYLIEPVKGVWLLAIDANAYVPVENQSGDSDNPKDFLSSTVGYNTTVVYKKHLIDWVKKVAVDAKKRGKLLISFSHYPMIDFNDDASSEMKKLFGTDKMQLQRVPEESIAQIFADAGLQIHFGGHMHINDTGIRTSHQGKTLFNIQTPSLAAYKPAYKILTIHSNTQLEVETIVVKSVPKFNSLFPFYDEEYNHLEKIKSAKIWNKDILKVKDYEAFVDMHLKELTRLRFIPQDFPVHFLTSIKKLSGKDLVLINNDLLAVKNQLIKQDLVLHDFESWSANDMIYDFYKLKNADELAFSEIGAARLKQYKMVCDELEKNPKNEFALWGTIFKKMMNGQPSNHFKINLKTNTIERIKP